MWQTMPKVSSVIWVFFGPYSVLRQTRFIVFVGVVFHCLSLCRALVVTISLSRDQSIMTNGYVGGDKGMCLTAVSEQCEQRCVMCILNGTFKNDLYSLTFCLVCYLVFLISKSYVNFVFISLLFFCLFFS